MREDLNVPLSFDCAQDDKQVEIADYGRIDAALPTLRWLHFHDVIDLHIHAIYANKTAPAC